MSASEAPSKDPLAAKPQLRHSTLTQVESLGQSIANIAPTLMPALNVAVIAKLAGCGAWLTYGIATVGMLFVAANIGALARRHTQSGSYFIYIGRTFGPFAGAISGWSMITAYLFTAVAVTVSAIIFLGNAMSVLGIGVWTPPASLQAVVFVALVWLAGYRDINLSSRLALVLEGVSIAIIVSIIIVVVVRHGSVVDHTQLDGAKFSSVGVVSALTLAIFSFVGFESAATLAKETRNPSVAVPRAIMISAASVGVFFVFMTYFMVLGMGGDAASLGASSAPFTDLTQKVGLGWVAGIVYFSAMISSGACAIASINAASRVLFSMGRYRFIDKALGAVHSRHQTPHIAVTLCCGVTLLVCLTTLPLGAIDAYGLTATFATFGFLLVYLLVCLAAPIDLRNAGLLLPRQAAVAVIGALLMAFVIFGSLYPAPPYPYNLVPYLFAIDIGAGAVWFGFLKWRRPSLLAAIEHDLEL